MSVVFVEHGISEDEINLQIESWQQVRNSQPHEVAAKFACEARSHLRDGKIELAERKMIAAYNVVGVVNGSAA